MTVIMENKMDWKKVKSSNIEAMAYADGTVKVQFKNGTEYHYQGVPKEVFLSVVNAESVGRAFNHEMKSQGFAFGKVALGCCRLVGGA
jgi:hypothetical protein